VDLPYKRILVVSLGGIHGECSLTLSVVLATWDIRLKKAPQIALSRSFSRPVIHRAEGSPVAHCAVDCSVLERIP
jgi:hypothetical protein